MRCRSWPSGDSSRSLLTRFLIPKNFGREWSKSRGRREAGTAPLYPGGRPGNPELRRKRFPKKFWEGGPQSEKSTCEVTAPLHRAGMFLGRKIPGGFSWAPHRLRGLSADGHPSLAIGIIRLF